MRASIFFCSLYLFTSSFSQNGNQVKTIQDAGVVLNSDSIVYWNARVHTDYGVAANALYYMMAKKPDRSVAYKDSLTTIYYLASAYQKCVITGTEVLLAQPDNLRIMELVAISERMLGNTKVSLELYERLYNKTASLMYSYYIAEMQFNLQRYGECLSTLEKLLSAEDIKKEKIELITTASSKQTVTLEAAALNIKGMTYSKLGKKSDAEKAFNNALLIEQDFVLAKANLEELNNKKSK